MTASPSTIVADCTSNHMGDMNLALEMIDAAAEVGVDMVKFQSWRAERLRKDYTNYDATYARHRRTELSDDDHHRLIERCRARKIRFLTTCFDLERVEFLASLGLEAIKVASPDCASWTLLDRLRRAFPRMIVSTGMSTDEEVAGMVERLRGHDLVVLHCVSIYPTPLDKVNLERMAWIRSLGVRAGFSDHSLGTDAGKLAIALGAEILEKHFTLSRRLPGKDQAMSTEPEEFRELVRWSRCVSAMRGQAHPGLGKDELACREAYVGKWGNNR